MEKRFSPSSLPNPGYSLGRGVATAGGGASQGSTCTSRWVRRRTREEKAAARLWGLWAASRHSRYWSSSQPRGLMPSSSGGGEKQAKAGRVSRAVGEAGLDRSTENEGSDGRYKVVGMQAGNKAPVLMMAAGTWETRERSWPWAGRRGALGYQTSTGTKRAKYIMQVALGQSKKGLVSGARGQDGYRAR